MKIKTAKQILDNGHAIYFSWYGVCGSYFIYYHSGFVPLGGYSWCESVGSVERLDEFIKKIGKFRFYLFFNDSYNPVKEYVNESTCLMSDQKYIKNPKFLK